MNPFIARNSCVIYQLVKCLIILCTWCYMFVNMWWIIITMSIIKQDVLFKCMVYAGVQQYFTNLFIVIGQINVMSFTILKNLLKI